MHFIMGSMLARTRWAAVLVMNTLAESMLGMARWVVMLAMFSVMGSRLEIT